MKSLRVQLAGGLGNQLFQFAAGLYFSNINKRELVLIRPESRDSKYFHDFGLWEVSGVNVARRPKLLRSGLGGLLWRADRKFLVRFKTYGILRGIYQSHESENLQLDLGKIRELRGYFQNLKYAEFSRNQIIEILKDASNESNQLEGNQDELISLHIRRGDYLKLADIYGTLSTSYYSESLSRCAEKIGSKKVIVFSDDILGAEKILSDPIFNTYNFNFVPLTHSPLDSINLMINCSAHILANSTFSWWGAFISDTSKIVTYPAPWTINHKPELDFFPSTWVRIQAN